MKNYNTHSILLALVGGYMLNIAYELISRMLSGSEDMSPAAAIAFGALFALAGIAVLLYAWKVWKDGKTREKQSKDHAEDHFD